MEALDFYEEVFGDRFCDLRISLPGLDRGKRTILALWRGQVRRSRILLRSVVRVHELPAISAAPPTPPPTSGRFLDRVLLAAADVRVIQAVSPGGAILVTKRRAPIRRNVNEIVSLFGRSLDVVKRNLLSVLGLRPMARSLPFN